MATAASRENEENTATGGQRTWDGNVLPAEKRSRMSYVPTLYLARGAALIKWAWSEIMGVVDRS